VTLDLECTRFASYSRYDETTRKDMGNRPFVQEKTYDHSSSFVISFDQPVEIIRPDPNKRLRHVQEETSRPVRRRRSGFLRPWTFFAGQNGAGR
jgi:hypothetical protein